ncbi:MAG: Gfo/Idh/MocA family oxidoreductase [Melioribacteraceae bacterium]|nr:Gfo/Idh/MocA family oxidoreductase [Melioribacteraceae bacterium]
MSTKKSQNQTHSSDNGISRRQFIGRTTLAAAAFSIVPRHVLGGQGYRAPSDILHIANIGIGGKGNSDSNAVAHENVVALCDVDDTQGEAARLRHPDLKVYRDFRVMLDKEKDIEAVTISTPDHTHAVIAMEAMRRGIHVFVQKPLTHTVKEARTLAKFAKENKIVSQMGNQGHAGEAARLVNEWIWDGAIGDVTKVDAFTNRPIWPQGMIERTKEIPSVPPTLDWISWLGPAPFRAYHPDYHPFSWRGRWDFGTGAIGDMGAHIMDHPFWALDLGLPKTIQASSTNFNSECYPEAEIITWTFPERDGKPPVTFKWYDGGLMPERPEDLEPGRQIGDSGGGVVYYGSKGKLMHSTYGSGPRLFPETFMKEYKRPEKTIERSPGIHQEWIDAIKNGTKSTTDFEYAAKLTEVMLLGNIAVRLKDKNTILEYDGEKGEFTNVPEANDLLHYEYAPGWKL